MLTERLLSVKIVTMLYTPTECQLLITCTIFLVME